MSVFDFTNTSDQGFAVLPVGEYQIRTGEWWLAKKEETGNLVIHMDTEIIEGQYKGETPRYFHSITSQEFSKGYLLKMLKALNIIQEGDRTDKGELKAEFVYGDTDDSGKVQILSIVINGEDREIEGLRATAVVTARNDKNTGERITGISRLQVPKGSTKAKGKVDIPANADEADEEDDTEVEAPVKKKAPAKKKATKGKGLPF